MDRLDRLQRSSATAFSERDEPRQGYDQGLATRSSRNPDSKSTSQHTSTIVVASTFTVDPLTRPLGFWLETLDIAARVELAPYAQVMQLLLSPQSAFAGNSSGFNVLVVRLQDWVRDRLCSHQFDENAAHLDRSADDLVAGIESLQQRTSVPLLLFLCPTSRNLSATYQELLARTEAVVCARVASLANVHCATHAELAPLYPLADYEDERSDRIGHIPFTNDYFTAMATQLARRITALSKPGYKAVAVDCDNTLWQGICGEDGPGGVELTAAHLAFQDLLVRQHDAGVLLCLCSKNNIEDVQAVFRTRPEMRLREEHLIASRINWEPKSANLRSLAEELSLGLDAFVFVDDSAMECAEVRKGTPAVLTLQFPESAQAIAHFCSHVWAFDRVGVTEEARRRTAQYKENRLRQTASKQAASLEDFIHSLELKVDITEMQATQLPRVAELVQRTNQFNLTGRRRRAGEIEALCSSGQLRCLVIHVRDRFGDYGLVGVLLLRPRLSVLEVDTFLVSCRMLGRGVEYAMVRHLGRLAQHSAVPTVALIYRKTQRNAPARDFLTQSVQQFQAPSETSDSDAETLFAVPTDYAISLRPVFSAEQVDGGESAASDKSAQARDAQARFTGGWHEAAFRLSRIADITRELSRRESLSAQTAPTVTDDPAAPYIPPRTPTQEAIAAIWCEVLGLPRVSATADFFDLGGDSLLAVQVISRIGANLGAELSLHEFFERPALSEMATLIEAGSRGRGSSIPLADRSRPVPLSWAQQRLWFIDQLEGSKAYQVPLAVRLHGELSLPTLQEALEALVSRHEILRTTFVTLDGVPTQQIAAVGQWPLPLVDLTASDSQDAKSRKAEQLREQLEVPFDLGSGPLFRSQLLRLGPSEHVLQVCMHHIICDDWSRSLLVRELAAVYEAGRDHVPNTLATASVQYGDYASWQREALTPEALQTKLSYWKEQLQGAPALLELPTVRPRPAIQSYRGESFPLRLEPELVANLRAFARRFDVTLAMTLYAVWTILLSRLSAQEDIVSAIPVANRNHPQLEGLVGYFVNTLAVRVRLEDDPSVAELLGAVKTAFVGALAHHEAPFEQVVDAVRPVRSLSYSPIFQVMFVLHNSPHHRVEVPGLAFFEEEVPLRSAQFDLLLSLRESNNGIDGYLNYATDLFDRDTIERWTDGFRALLNGLLADSQVAVSKLPLVSDEARRLVLEGFNATQAIWANEAQWVHGLFEAQAARTPAAVAVEFESKTLTYADLNGRANQLARHLRSRGVGPDSRVALYMERSLEMVLGLMGILKAGGAYVPVDPSYPTERVAYMLTDAAPQVVLTQQHLKTSLPATHGEILTLDLDWPAIARHSEESFSPASLGLRPDHLAYVIYTSGSTGQPQGAMNEHRGVVNRLLWMQSAYGLSAADRVLQKTPFSFDVSVWEFFWTLATGARLVVARPEGHKDPHYLSELIRSSGITTLHFVPSMLQVFLDQQPLAEHPTLRHVVCSGEELSAALQGRCFECLPHVRLSNLYGPTEAAVDVTAWECRADDQGARVPIGHPITNIRMYVLDRRGQPVTIGAVGEIFIGGVGVGRGYLNKPDLTRARFLPDPFSATAAARMYRTGDLGRWRPDGALEYLGRNDFQVKIRGLRIELGEIEAQLTRYPGIKEAAVLAREDRQGEKRLVAYILPAARVGNDELTLIEHCRSHLHTVLPEYMVPTAFVTLERFPLSPNGKLDRNKLPAPQLAPRNAPAFEPPCGELEQTVVGLWQELLGVERVGRHDNFFELGGHSLLIAKLMDRLRRIGLAADVRGLYTNSTVASLGEYLKTRHVGVAENLSLPSGIPSGTTVITPQMLPLVDLSAEQIKRIARTVPGGAVNIQDIYPLAPLQEGILFHHLLGCAQGDAYVAAILLVVSSYKRAMELAAALQKTIERHDVLRTAILWEDLRRPVQVVHRQAQLPIETVTLGRGAGTAEQVARWLEPEEQKVDVREAPLVRLRLAEDPSAGDQWYALLRLHHIIGDNTSQEIIISEIVADLNGVTEPKAAPVPYRHHVAQALAYAATHAAAEFFRGKLSDVTEPTAPFEIRDTRGNGFGTAQAQAEIDITWSQRLRTQARRAGVSPAVLFHAAWALVVSATSAREDVVFGTVLLGRLHGATETQGMVGMLINTLPLRIGLQQLTSEGLVRATATELMELLNHEQASLALAQSCSGVPASTALFSTLLNYRHATSSAAALWEKADGIRLLQRRDLTNYPITLSVDDLGEGFGLVMDTDRRIDPRRLLGYVQSAVRSLVQALELAPETPALALEVLPEPERQHLLRTLNATQLDYSREKLVHELFEEQALLAPTALAVVHGERSLTYAELNRKANQLARYLLNQGVGPEQLVGICTERSPEMVIGLLASLKAGAAYVPLDPSYPPERLQHMLQDAAPRVILLQHELQGVLPPGDAERLALDTHLEKIAHYVGENLAPAELGLSPRHPVYVIYTSGSTGRPKGTAMAHTSMVNLLQWHRIPFGAQQGQRTLQFAALGFDVAFQETLSTLCSGGTLVLLDEWVRRDPRALTQLLSQQNVHRLFLPPLMLQSLAECWGNAQVPLSLRHVATAGEPLRITPQIVHLFEQLPGCQLHNHYGPTETHVVTALTLHAEPRQWPALPSIGRPIANTQIYVLDAQRKPVPAGVAGEIYIGGVGVACGYLHRAELTAQRFLQDPFSSDPAARMYRSGDLGRWREEGTLEYLGRNDDQVKLRGFRIELGEIAAQLQQHPSVKDAVVIAREDVAGDKRLVAYLTPHGEPAVDTEVLRAHLKTVLPEHMLPAVFVVLEQLPLSPNGKLDRGALPAPAQSTHSARTYEAPQGETEQALARIWQEILRVQRVSRLDNFFELGGHSLLAMQLLVRIQAEIAVELPMPVLFYYPILRELAVRVEKCRQEQFLQGLADGGADIAALSSQKAQLMRFKITARPRPVSGEPQRLRASAAQQRMWFVDQLEGGSSAYHIPIALRLHGVLDYEALQQALDAMIERHETLRTGFICEDGTPRQEISVHASFPLQRIDLSDGEAQPREERIQLQRRQEAQVRFDLRRAPLIRGRLLCLQPREHMLLITMHHIISDGWSIGILIEELAQLYSAYREGATPQLRALAIQYADYALWQSNTLQGAPGENHLAYWRERLSGAPPQLDLPTDRPRPAVQSYRGENLPVCLDATLTARVKRLAQQRGLTLFMLLYGAWAIVLARLSGQQDLVIGTPVANRGRPELEGLIGLFVNALVLRAEVRPDLTVQEFLERIKSSTLEAYTHQDVPFEKIVETIQPERRLDRSPLFQVMLALQNAPAGTLRATDLTAEMEEELIETAKFDLTLSLEERADQIQGVLNYATDLFDRSTLERWFGCFVETLQQLLESPTRRIGELSILPRSQWEELVQQFNATAVAHPQKLIHQLFEEQVARTPDALAASCAEQSLNYRELNERANRLAWHLIASAVTPGQLVGICLTRGIDMLVGILATLKAGAAYVPLDPGYPLERLRHMLSDAAPQALLSHAALVAKLPLTHAKIVLLERDAVQIGCQRTTNPDPHQLGLKSDNLAYIIYTSGSTGLPKGVAIEHRNTSNLIQWALSVTAPEVFGKTLQSTSLNFDLAVYECFVPLACGGAVRIVPNALAIKDDPAAVTLINTVPSAIRAVLDERAVPAATRVISLAGEPLKEDLVKRIFVETSVEEVWNLYGPSETTTYSTWLPMSRAQGFVASIGRPVDNTQVYLLDSSRQLVPRGAIGEIYIGGAGLARGYLNRPELTTERFISNPLWLPWPGRLYKTGDLGRWRADGTLEYVGRNDDQVKVRGFRIELGEIEAQLLRLETAKEVAVIAREEVPGERRLVAYVVPAGAPVAAEDLRAHLKAALPEYMIPSAFVTLTQMPLTSNGKLDRKALPSPELGAFATRVYEAPVGELEQTLAGIWRELLRVERIGRRDNFFELGGHSLLIVRMLDRLRRIGLTAEVRGVYASANLAELATVVQGNSVADVTDTGSLIPPECEEITPEMLPLVELQPEQIAIIVRAVPGGAANIQDVYPLAPLQEGILFHHLLIEDGGDPYVLPMLFTLSSREKLDSFISALQFVIARHDVLRSAVLWEHLPRPVQVVYRRAVLSIEQRPVSPGRALEQIKEGMQPWRQKMHLQRAPLLQLETATDTSNDHWYALLRIHHLACDYKSLDTLLTEVMTYINGRGAELPEPQPYRQHVAQVLQHARAHDAEVFFRRKLADVDSPTAPFGLLDVHADGSNIEEAHGHIEPALGERLRAQARRLNVSPATVFHAAWGLILACTTGRNDVVFGSVLLGRLQSTAESSRMLGLFINTLPMRLTLEDLTAQECVQRSQQDLVELLTHEQASLAVAQSCSRVPASTPLFSTLLNYRHSAVDLGSQLGSAPGVQLLMAQARTNYPITLSVDDLGEGFGLVMDTDRRIDPRRLLGYVQSAVRSLVQALELAPETPALALEVLPEPERQHLLRTLNATQLDYSREKLVHELFEEQALLAPTALAVVHGERSLTYAELNRKANQLARYLLNQGVGPEQLVGICTERSPEMVIGLLASLKAGAAYVPLDPSYPPERLQHMLQDAAPRVILLQHELQGVLPPGDAERLALDTHLEKIAHYVGENLAPAELGLSPRHPVYVIYTSGSTGRPKGTAMAHTSMVNLLQWHRIPFGAQQGQRTLQFAALGFDVAFQETLSTLCSGGTLVLLDEWVRRDPRALTQLLSQQNVHRLFLPPLMLQSLAECWGNAQVPLSLRHVATAGEPLRITPQIVHLFEQLPGCQLHNHYGPTETHVVTALTLHAEPRQWPALPSIGRPIANTQIYVLDAQRKPVPAGVAGEIYIGGVGVACGYLHRAELTAQRFLQDPFSSDPAARMYRSGDLGRWREEGTLEYLGRNDDQVKLRGFRIELGEIAAQLQQHPSVKDAVVIAREDVAGDKRLVAYLTPHGEPAVDTEVLRAHLKTVLPEHMLPAVFVVLEQLPLSPNGKLDRGALPAPAQSTHSARTYEAPQGETEQALARIWQEILRVQRVSRLDNFFELGGHSLHVMRLNVKVADRFAMSLSVAAAFKHPTLRQMAVAIDSLRATCDSTESSMEFEAGVL